MLSQRSKEVPFPVVLVFILLCGCYAQGAKINSFQKKMSMLSLIYIDCKRLWQYQDFISLRSIRKKNKKNIASSVEREPTSEIRDKNLL